MEKDVKVTIDGTEVNYTTSRVKLKSQTAGESRIPFDNIEDSTIFSAGDLMQGVIGYGSDGTRYVGTGGGGGGGNSGYPIETDDYGVIFEAMTDRNIGILYKWTGATLPNGYFVHGETYRVGNDSEEVY